MTESLIPTAEQVAAARLRVVLDRRMGKTTPAIVHRIAQADSEEITAELVGALAPGPQGERRDPADEPTLPVRQREVLRVIRDWVDRYGYPPSVREIGEAVGLTATSSVAHILRSLERKGYLRRNPNRPRAIELMPAEPAPDRSTPKPAYVPVLGRIAASGPILSPEPVEDVFPLPREIVGEGSMFRLRVHGDSMIDAAIADGDWVVVRRQPHADNGDIVVAIIDGEPKATSFKRGIPGDDVIVLGVVVAVLRRL